MSNMGKGLTGKEWRESIRQYGELLIDRYQRGKMNHEKLIRLAVKHKTWINLAVERGIYHD